MNRDLLRIIRAVADASIHAHIDTNLTSKEFSDQSADALIRSGLKSLFVSADGVTQEVYQKYRVRGDLARVFRNVQRLQQAKERAGSDLPMIGWQFYVHKFNEHEIDAAREIAEKMHIPIVFKLLSVPDQSWASKYHDHTDTFVDGKEFFFSVYNPVTNAEVDQVPLNKNIIHVCKQIFQTMVIDWNGNVLPCTCVPGQSQYVMGNLFTDTLNDVWNGEKFKASRQFILNYGPRQNGPSVCENCSCPLTKKWDDGC